MLKLRIQFPCDIKQVNPNEVEVDCKLRPGSLLTPDAIEQVAPDLSATEQDKLHDDITMFAIGEGIKRSLRVR